MTLADIKFEHALLPNGERVSIRNITQEFAKSQSRYTCPVCGMPMTAVWGIKEIRAPHFRHLVDRNSERRGPDNSLHTLAEHTFYEEYANCLDKGLPFYLKYRVPAPCNNACVLKKHIDCPEHYYKKSVDLTKYFTLLSLETTVDVDGHNRRPDILLESEDGEQLWIEIWVSHETEVEKRKDGHIIEIKVESKRDLNRIQKHVLEQSYGEDQSVRLFNLNTDLLDALGIDKTTMVSFPCDNEHRFSLPKYKIQLRLNWLGKHDSVDGTIGTPVTEEELNAYCDRRYDSLLRYGAVQESGYDTLIVYESQEDAIKPAISRPNSNNPYISNWNRPTRSNSIKEEEPVVQDYLEALTKVQWIDLGLPSGTLWAKEDMPGTFSFSQARWLYGRYLPSKGLACELRDSCTMRWDGKSMVLTGPNGNSLVFDCDNGSQSYWLKDYEDYSHNFGQCYRIISGGSVFVNDDDVSKMFYLRLVNYKDNKYNQANGEDL